MERVLVLGDSLSFHGPTQPELLTHPDLFPNVLGRLLGAEVDTVARLGWTARDAWWALTRDPYVVRATGGRMRTLPQAATLRYLTRCVEAIRTVRPGVPVVGIVPPPYDAPYYGNVTRTHAPAVAAHRAWGAAHGVPLADLDAAVGPHLAAGTLNPDGMHWSWAAHEDVARAVAEALKD